MNPNPQTPPPPSLIAGIITGLVVVGIPILLIMWVFSCDGGEEIVETFDKGDALIQSRQFVEAKLVAPGTAEWAFESHDSQVRQINDTVFIVNSYVDSQNQMGALIRTNYRCDIVFVPSEDKVLCKNMNLWE